MSVWERAKCVETSVCELNSGEEGRGEKKRTRNQNIYIYKLNHYYFSEDYLNKFIQYKAAYMLYTLKCVELVEEMHLSIFRSS